MLTTRRALGALALLPAVARAQGANLRIAGGLATEAPQFALALDRGSFREAGLNPTVTNFATGREGFEALIGGAVDVALMAELPAVVGALRGQRFGILAVLSRYAGSVIMAKRKPGIEARVASLAGRKIGVTVGTNTHFMLMGELAAAGVTAEIVNVGPADLIPALSRGDIEAAAPFPNAYAGARRVLGAELIQIPVSTYLPTYLAAASEAFLGAGDAAQRFVAALVRAEGMMTADVPAAQAATARVAGRAQPLQAVQDAWGDYRYRVALDRDLLDLMLRQGRWLAETNAVRGAAPTEATFRAVIAEAPLRAAAPDRVTL